MLLYTFYCVFIVSLSFQSSIGFDIKDSANPVFLQADDEPQSKNETTLASTPIQNEKTCDKTTALQKILEVMLSMLRDDLSESSKTSFVLQTFKEVLKNTAGQNDEVMYKIDDLIRTLDKYEETRDKTEDLLRSGNTNNKMRNSVRENPKNKQKIRLNYELPNLTNSHCTEALLSIINIAYRAYVSLEKNPICHIPDLSTGSSGTNPFLTDFYKSIFSNLKPHPGTWDNLFPNHKLPTSPSGIPSNVYPNNLIKNDDIINPYSEKLPVYYKPTYEYHPNTDNDDSELPPNYIPETPNSLTPDQKNPISPLYLYPTNTLDNADSPNISPYDHLTVKPYKPLSKNPYPEINPKTKLPKFLFDEKSQQRPLNFNYPEVVDPLHKSKILLTPHGKNTLIPSNVTPQSNPYNQYEFLQPSTNLKYIPLLNYTPYDTKYLPTEYKFPDLEIQKHKLLHPYLFQDPDNPNAPAILTDDDNEVTEVNEFPHKPHKLKPNKLHPYFIPVNPFTKDPSSPIDPIPITNDGDPETKVYDFPYKPDTSKLNSLHPYFIPINSPIKDPTNPSAPLTDDSESEVFEFPYKPDQSKPNHLQPYFIPTNSLIKDLNNPITDVNKYVDNGNQGTQLYEFPYKLDKSKMNHLHPHFVPINSYINDPSSSFIADIPLNDDGNQVTEVDEIPYKPDKSKPNHLHPYFIPVNPTKKDPNHPSILVPYVKDDDPETKVFEVPFKPNTSKLNNLPPYLIPINTFVKDPKNPVYVTDADNQEIKVGEFPYKFDKPKTNLHPYFIPINPLSKNPDALVIDDGSSESKKIEANPDTLSLDSPISQKHPSIPTHKYIMKEWDPSFQNPGIPDNQNPFYVSKLNPDDPIIANIPNKLPNFEIHESSQENPFSETDTSPPKSLQVPELEIIGFIRDAITIIEGTIPVVEFDPPTLYIIARIKNILVKDVGEDDYVTILELYKKLIDYVKHLKVYKQIIDLIELPSMTNLPKLKTKKVVELTYLVKRPQPVVYYPYYYVKYRLPYPSFVIAAKHLLREKPHLRTNINGLYEELLSSSKVAKSSPGLKSQEKKDIMGLTFKSGSFIDARLIGENGTLPEKLNILKHVTSPITTEKKMDLDEKVTNQLLNRNPETVNNSESHQNETEDDELNINLHTLLRTGISNIHQNESSQNFTTGTNLDFTSFESNKLRDEILKGEHVGLPFSNYIIPTKADLLNEFNEPNPNMNRGSIAFQKLADSTLEASQMINAYQQNHRNSGTLVNLDGQNVSLNTGTENHQESVNISNPKLMMNKVVQSSKNSNNAINTASHRNYVNSINTAVNKIDQQNLANMWTNQQNFYNSGGLANFDNQNILLNTGTGNRQNDVNIVNPKVFYNEATDTKTSKAPHDQFNIVNINSVDDDSVTIHETTNADTTSDRVTHQESLDDSNINPTEAFNRAVNHDGLVKFENASTVIYDQKHNTNADNTQNTDESTRPSSSVQDSRPTSATTFNTDEENKQNSINYNNDNIVINEDQSRPQNSQHSTNVDNYVTPTPQANSAVNNNKKSFTVNPQTANHDLNDNNYDARIANRPNNAVSPFNNQMQQEFDYQGSGFGFNTGTAGQQYHGGTTQQNIIKVASSEMYRPVSQQNIASYGTNNIGYPYPGQQMNSYSIVPSMQMYYQQPVVQRFPMNTAMPYYMRFRTPVNYNLG